MKKELEAKVPPSNKGIEGAVLGAMILDSNCVPFALSRLFEGCFYANASVNVFRAIRSLYDSCNKIDFETVYVQTTKDKSGVAPYDIVEMTKSVVSTANLDDHINLLLELYMKREAIRIGVALSNRGYDPSQDAFDTVEYGAEKLAKLQESTLKGLEKGMPYYVGQVEENIQKAQETGQIGISTGLKVLDETLNGWCNPDLIVIAARPGMGKTALAISSMHDISVNRGIPSAFFSLEMKGAQLTERILSIDSGLPHWKIHKGKINEGGELEAFNAAKARVKKSPIHIASEGMNIRDLRTRAMVMKKTHRIEVIFVDYLQLMSGVKGGNREQEISEISRGLKMLAMDIETPIIALSQLSRAVESRSDKMPQLSDLRESGAIEQDADGVIFLMRPEYYNMMEPVTIGNETYEVPGLTIAKVDKNRHGSTKNLAINFQAESMRYTDHPKHAFQSGSWKKISGGGSFDDGFKDDQPF